MGKTLRSQKPAQKTSVEPTRVSQKESGLDQATPLHPMLRLQQTVGNQAVLRLLKSGGVQTKLKINQPGDVYEQEADQAAEEVMSLSDGVATGISDSPPNIQKKCEACASGQGTCPNCAEEEEEVIQRKPIASTITPLIQLQEKEPAARTETPPPGLIVEDEAEDVRPGQMRKSEFLSQLKTSVCSAADEALSGTIWSAMGCPYIERWFEHYGNQDGGYIERALRKYAPEAGSVRSAREYIPIVTQRVRRGIRQWTETGEVTGVPEEFAKGGMPGVTAGGLIGGLVGGALSAVGGVVSGVVSGVGRAVSGIGRALFKGREGGARDVDDSQAIQSQLSSGHSLDGGVKSRMESAFGMSFSNVRIHTDSKASGLSDRLNARAFTIGSDIAFGSGEYQPGTPIGDALIAHELAHVVQQGGGRPTAALLQKGGTEYSSLEEDADISAVGAVASVWGGVKGVLKDIGRNATPRLKSGLRLQRCGQKTPLPTNVGMSTAPSKPVAAAPTPRKPLLDDFADKFPEAADLIRQSPPAMELVRKAESVGVKFGGYSEDKPDKNEWASTQVNTVYIPRAHHDKMEAMASFLFELNNAIRQPQFGRISEQVIAGTITAKEFARRKVEIEVEGMLDLGERWIEMKKAAGDKTWDKYDNEFYLPHVQAVKAGRKTKNDLVNEVLQWQNGIDETKTNEQYYMDQYYRYKKFSSSRQ